MEIIMCVHFKVYYEYSMTERIILYTALHIPKRRRCHGITYLIRKRFFSLFKSRTYVEDLPARAHRSDLGHFNFYTIVSTYDDLYNYVTASIILFTAPPQPPGCFRRVFNIFPARVAHYLQRRTRTTTFRSYRDIFYTCARVLLIYSTPW